MLEAKNLTISDLVSILDFTQTKTSRHVAYLKNAGLVKSQKLDQWVVYSLKEEVIEIVSKMLVFLQKDPQLLKDLEVYAIMDSNRELAMHKVKTKELRA